MTQPAPDASGDAAVISAAVSSLAAAAVGDLGLDLVEVLVKGQSGRRVVRVVVDGDQGVDVDQIASLSKSVSVGLDDDEAIIDGAYTLEVTSPGVDRPLTEPRQWRRNVGREVEVEHRVQSGSVVKQKQTTGKLAEASDEEVVVNVKGRMVTIALGDVDRAKVVLPW